MVALKVAPDEARKMLGWVEHEQFRSALSEHWQVADDGSVRAQGVLWLYCWAKTGQNSEDVANQVKNIFNRIMSVSYKTMSGKVPHEWAREMRYADGDIESDLARRLA